MTLKDHDHVAVFTSHDHDGYCPHAHAENGKVVKEHDHDGMVHNNNII